MNEQRFFRIASFLPLVVPAIAGTTSWLFPRFEGYQWEGVLANINNWLAFVALAGAYSALPYVVFLLLLHVIIRPKARRTWLRVLFVTPIALPIAVAVALGLYAGQGVGVLFNMDTAGFWGLMGLYTSVSYGLCIGALYYVGRRAGFIRRGESDHT